MRIPFLNRHSPCRPPHLFGCVTRSPWSDRSQMAEVPPIAEFSAGRRVFPKAEARSLHLSANVAPQRYRNLMCGRDGLHFRHVTDTNVGLT